ncbi:MAG: glycosyltransferase family 39 protein [Bacteroidales bacterium]|nr:glycosyltransferase family 39 protein [Bacteroidales bacterium]
MKYEQLNKKGYFIALIFIILSGLFIQWSYMNEFPSFIHAWSQTDRYAIALGFVNNDLDFFHPETFIYNKQFPHKWSIPHETTITSVDFPILEYIVAIIMKISGDTSPWIFRMCSLIVAFIGMFFLYKLTFIITKDWIKSVFVVAVAMTSPVYAYYYNGFIPGIPALTFMIIAFYCYLKYLNDNEKKSSIITIVFCTLSVLVRSSFAVAYVALLGFEFLRILRKETSFVNKIVPVMISFIIILSYYLWNGHLEADNGTLFLGELMPAKNWEDFVYRITMMKNNWLYHYFTNIHYWIFAFIIVASLIFCIYNFFKRKNDDVASEKTATLSLWWLCGILLLGDFCFMVAMVKQFPDHDYYFIDSFFLPILLLLILLLDKLPKVSNYKQGFFALLLSVLLIFFMLKDVKEMQIERRAEWHGRDSERTIKNYKGSEQYLDSLNISKDAKILTLYAYPQNAAFIMMNRKGYTAMFDKHDMVKNGLTFDYDYLIIENEILKKKLKENKEFLSDLEYYSDNGKITVFVKSE